ncbi:transposase [Candidatus Chloroploca sp. Khr17]|uniref:transposase n=1 Tax=Candidatus Chloroploca sp. Khr17 TaxID=2496869 RepID=UPI00101C6312|nr:transposase [Candidatus Chloroploca sp. Khr17]
MSKPPQLQPGSYYHIYHRGNNREHIFREERNYRYFLDLYTRHIHPIADTFAYCLMRNHLHLLVRMKAAPPPDQQASKLFKPSQSFANLFNAYAKAINKAYGRSGSLFQERFGRIEVTTERYLSTLVVYIHRNPQKHGFVTHYSEWPWSSYHTLCGHQETKLDRASVLSWFGGQSQFIAFHHEVIDEQALSVFIDEDGDMG